MLEGAAEAAAAQGAPIAAGELGEHAVRLTPAESRADVDRRAAAAVRAHLAAGEVERGRVLAAELAARAPAGAERAEALFLLAETEDLPLAVPLLKRGAGRAGSFRDPAGVDPPATEPLSSASSRGSTPPSSMRSRRWSWRRSSGDDGAARLGAGRAGADPLQRGRSRARSSSPSAPTRSPPRRRPSGRSPTFALGHILVWSGHFERARDLLETLYRGWSERDERMAADALWYLALVELRSGHLALAGEYAERVAEPEPRSTCATRRSRRRASSRSALVAAHRGDLDARAGARPSGCAELAEIHAARLHAPLGDARAGRALVRRRRQRPSRASPPPKRIADAADGAEPAMSWWRAEQVEALLELGLVDDAVVRLDAWEADARRLERDWVLAHATRCRGLVAAARGDVEQARRAARRGGRAARGGRRSVRPRPGAARARRHSAAGAAEAAGARGDRGGARRLRGARGRTAGPSGHARSSARSAAARAVEGLTPAERRVADLVANGRTNAEVAAALFLAERTVASHLTHVYAKLGVRSRTELARKLADRRGQSSDVLTFSRTRPGRSVDGMPSYLVETFLARGHAGERTAREARARSAAEELTRAGTRVRFDGVIHVPEDEICFFVFGAPSSRGGRARGAAGRARPRSRRRSSHVQRGVRHARSDSIAGSSRSRPSAALTRTGGRARGHGDAVER